MYIKGTEKKNLKTHEFVVGMLFPFSSIKWNCILYVQFNWDFQRKNGFSSIFVIFLWDLWLIQLFLEIFLVYFFSSKFIQTRPNLFQMIKIIFFIKKNPHDWFMVEVETVHFFSVCWKVPCINISYLKLNKWCGTIVHMIFERIFI